MAAGMTYEPIATTTLGSSASNITFSSISQSYTDLIIVVSGNTASGGEVGGDVKVGNNSVDTGGNYSMTELYATGSSAASYREASKSYLNVLLSTSGTSTTNTILQFMNYSNTTTYKTFVSRSNVPTISLRTAVGLWRSTSAINIIQIGPYTGSWAAGTTATIYGIAAA